MAEEAHSKWGPSGAERWMVCHASVKEGLKSPPRPPSVYAKEGTHAHAVLEYCLINQVARGRDVIGKLISAEHGPVDEDMADAIQEAIDFVAEIMASDPDAQLWVEVKVRLPLHDNPDDGWGTSDIVIWLPRWHTLYVVDYKHGAGIAVEVEDNKQIKSYGAGVVHGTPLGDKVNPQFIVLGVVQPRAFHAAGPVRLWHTTPKVLLDWCEQYDEAITATKGPNPQYVVDENVCRWCDGKLTCKALEAKALTIAGEAFKDVRVITPDLLPRPEDVAMDRVAYVMQAGAILKTWLKDFDAYAAEQAMQGVYVPGHKLVQSSNRRKYHGKPVEVAAQICDLTDQTVTMDDVYPRQLLNVTQMDKLIVTPGKGQPALSKKEKQRRKAMFDLIAVKEKSKNFSLVPESDSRPAINPIEVAFSGVAIPSSQGNS